MQGKLLGMAVGIFDEDGKDILKTGVPGETSPGDIRAVLGRRCAWD